MRVRSIFALIFMGAALCAHASDDPSLIPVQSMDGDGRYVERLRIVADFDRDGKMDMALSEPLENFGRMGGMFEVYICGKDGAWNLVGDLLLHQKAVSLESVPTRPRSTKLWSYLRGGSGYGGLGYYEISTKGVKEFQSLEISAGDAGTSTGNAIYDAVFAHSDLDYAVERSLTAADGTVLWEPVPWKYKKG